MNVNLWVGAGRLTRDPELRHTNGGTAVCEVGLAINRRYTDSSGNEKQEACFIDIVFWAKRAEEIAKNGKTGTAIYVQGRLETDEWTSPDGQKRSRLRVVGDQFQYIDRPVKPIDPLETA